MWTFEYTGQIFGFDGSFGSDAGLLVFEGSPVFVTMLFKFGGCLGFLWPAFLSFSGGFLRSDFSTSGEKTGSVARSASVSTNFTRS